jgi:hypothetical protein
MYESSNDISAVKAYEAAILTWKQTSMWDIWLVWLATEVLVESDD